jgi:toxin ParE1/3/4
MNRLIVAHVARADLKAIARHSEREWGTARKEQYLAAIRKKFSLLLRSPDIGVSRSDIGRGCRSLPVGRHIIFYRIDGEAVLVLRVLHQRMDARLHIGSDG